MNASPRASWPIFRTLNIASVFCGLCLAGCSASYQPAQSTWEAMGSFAGLTVAGSERERLLEYIVSVKAALVELEDRLSRFKPGSDIARINQAAGRQAVDIAPDTATVLALALHYASLSGGAFDPTVAPLMRLWGFNGAAPPGKEPGADSIHAALQFTGYSHLSLSNQCAFLGKQGVELDLGGIAKGYAVDVCYGKLMEMGARNVMMDIGGNIRCGGLAPGARPWQIGVRNPFKRDEIIGAITLSHGMAVATSGNYERFVKIGGVRYAHIMDPRTGRPVSGMAGVTVIATNAAAADAMSTALFVLGRKESGKVLARLQDCHALLIPDEQPLRIYLSAGFKKYFQCRPEFAGILSDL